ncbi:hypothetical protein, partial [Paraburkholderia caribensis]|uniref:hypothetical protein n=1 Tax=Paraburkholderia caribensis TaxID=75105 RepID=UPI001CC4373F
MDIGAGEDDSERIIVAGGQVFLSAMLGVWFLTFFFGGVVFAAVASLASARAVWRRRGQFGVGAGSLASALASA